MIIEKDIKPIPKYIIKRIKNKDKNNYYSSVNFYSYFTKMKKELVLITVACKHYQKQWFCKQVTVHAIHSTKCLVKDIEYSLMGYSVGWYEQGLTNNKKRSDYNKWYYAEDKYYNIYASLVNKKYALKFDEYKYSALDKYPYYDVLKYLRIYEQYPQAEYLIKIGLEHLATSKSILKKVGTDKTFRKWLIQNVKILRNEYGTCPYFSAKAILLSYKEKLPLLEGRKLDSAKRELLQDYTYKNHLSKIIKTNEVIKFLQYIEKQNTNTSSYIDYLTACEFLELDMNLDKNKFPHDFKKWHDIRIDQYHSKKAELDRIKRKELYTKFEKIANKYLSLQRNKEDDYAVIIAKSPQDLIKEGEILNHCVGRMNYDQKFIREESLIFFIRNKNELNTPFVTLEYSLDKHKILQCYGNNDTRPANEVLEFVNKKWLPYANRKLKKLIA